MLSDFGLGSIDGEETPECAALGRVWDWNRPVGDLRQVMLPAEKMGESGVREGA